MPPDRPHELAGENGIDIEAEALGNPLMCCGSVPHREAENR